MITDCLHFHNTSKRTFFQGPIYSPTAAANYSDYLSPKEDGPHAGLGIFAQMVPKIPAKRIGTVEEVRHRK